MKKLLFILLATVLLLSGCQKEAPPPPSLDWQLPSGITYGELERVIDDFAENNKDTMAGMSVSVFTRYHVLLEKYYGYANIEESLAVDADTVFDWGSITKTMVWVSAMQLYEQGKLDLNADIRNYLPDDFFKKLVHNEPITMLHLMNHTSGWLAGTGIDRIFVEWGETANSLEQELRLAEPAQGFFPGIYQQYSNYGAAMAGYVVERISGMPFYEYVHTNFFEPLGMAHTAIKPDLSDNEWVQNQRGNLMCYGIPFDQIISSNNQFELSNLGTRQYLSPLYPAGFNTGTLSDMRRYGQVLLPDINGASSLFKKAATLEEIYTSTYTDEMSGENCHGFWKYPFENTVVGHSGGSLGCTSILLIDIDSGVGVAVMTNMASPIITGYMIGDVIADIIYGERKEPQQDFDASAEKTESGVRVTWIPENETTGYWIYRSGHYSRLGEQLNEKSAIGGEYIDETADLDATYYYTIVKTGSDPAKGIKAKYQ